LKNNTENKLKISVYGSGYVGLATSILLSQSTIITIFDIDERKIKLINKNISPIADKDIDTFFKDYPDRIRASKPGISGFTDADFVVICTPTDYDTAEGCFDTSSVEQVIKDVLDSNFTGFIIIKSTVPVGFTDSMCKKYNTENIVFSPEFSREGNSLYDLWYPSRIVVGSFLGEAKKFGNLLCKAAKKSDVELIFMNSFEAEAVKLFSNTYLAMRVAFFNELDSFGLMNNLNVKNIINGVCMDQRIGQFYNNPSFGYGGYCLPKDSKQLLSSFQDIPQQLIKATIASNEIRKKFIADYIKLKKPKLVGIYQLAMKKNSDNHRNSPMHEIIELLKSLNIPLIIYEPLISEEYYKKIKVLKSLNDFKKTADLIIANRLSIEIEDIAEKVFTRDIFNIE
jgi:UDPglucose 6-dehydrogenase